MVTKSTVFVVACSVLFGLSLISFVTDLANPSITAKATTECEEGFWAGWYCADFTQCLSQEWSDCVAETCGQNFFNDCWCGAMTACDAVCRSVLLGGACCGIPQCP